MSEKILLVEGGSDSGFFRSLTNRIGIGDLSIKPPTDVSQPSNGVDNVIKSLPLILRQITDGSTCRLGVVIDADYTSNSNGPEHRYNQVTNELKKYNYTIPVYAPKNDGHIFTNNEGMPNVGLWIMPNNESDGMLEDLIICSVKSEQQKNLLDHATTSVNALPVTLFNIKIHLQKALTNTLLSWQKYPGSGLSSAIRDNIIDLECAEMKNLCSWLSIVFNLST